MGSCLLFHFLPLALLAYASSVLVPAQSRPLWQMQHVFWRGHDGAPQGIDSIGEGQDGQIWISVQGKLFHFDGLTFERYTSPTEAKEAPRYFAQAKTIRLPNGDLWFFRAHGVPFCIRNGEMKLSRVENDARSGTTYKGAKDREGRLFAVQDHARIVQLDGNDAWHVTTRYAHTSGFLSDLAIDAGDTAWLVLDQRLFRLSIGDTQPRDVGVDVGFDTQIVPLPDRTLWLMTPLAPSTQDGQDQPNLRRVDQAGHLVEQPLAVKGVSSLLAASDGSLWISADDRGTWKIPARAALHAPNTVSKVPLKLDESANFVSSASGPAVEARDGSIWIGGTTGLDEFLPATLIPALPKMHPGSWAVCANAKTGPWLADDGGILAHLTHNDVLVVHDYKNKGLNAHLACGQDGKVWVSTAQGIAEVKNGKLRFIPAPPGHDHAPFLCWGITYSNGKLTVLTDLPGSHSFQQRMWTFSGGSWTRELPAAPLGKVFGIMRNASGALLLSLTDGTVLLASGDHLRRLGTPGLDYGRFCGFAETTYGTFAYGETGLALLQGNSIMPLEAEQPEQIRWVTGLSEAKNGDLWLTGGEGVVRISAAEAQHAVQQSTGKLHTTSFAEADVTGPDDVGSGRSSAHTDGFGRLWFTTIQGVFSLDPSKALSEPKLPNLTIRSITSARSSMDGQRTSPSGTTDISIRYFGMLLSAPKTVRYRYRLLGAEAVWHDAGAQTEATYAHLRPGAYRFEVVAGNSYGIWTPPVLSPEFHLAPYFWQTWWFLVCLIAVTVWIARLLYHWRVQLVRDHARLLADERAEERTRIARELHDTLLQGMQGLLLNFAVVRERLLQGCDVIPLLDRSLSATESLLVEGRERIGIIRHPTTGHDDLEERLRALCLDLTSENGIDVQFQVLGARRQLLDNVSEELFSIGREALRNSLKHSAATKIVTTLRYKHRMLRMDCHDNGSGFVVPQHPRLRSDRSWGLHGMQERCDSIRADMRVLSSPRGGTSVIVRLDAKSAYKAQGRKLRTIFGRHV